MRILLLVTAFNGVSQRVYEQLRWKKHQVSVVFGANDSEIRQSIDEFEPAIIICPFLKQRIAEDIWRKHLCIIIHPGIKGDRGPSSLDWSILNQDEYWGVTALQADTEMDAGAIWSSRNFKTRSISKASMYRQQVSDTSAQLIDDVIQHFQDESYRPEPLDYSKADVKGQLQPLLKQCERMIDWKRDNTDTIIKKIHAADSFPGVLDNLCGLDVYLFGAHIESSMTINAQAYQAKEIIATRKGAICLATIDGAIWVSHLKRKKTDKASYIKLPASQVLQGFIDHVAEAPLELLTPYLSETYKEISYYQDNGVGYLYFNFHNGAMGTQQCIDLLEAYQALLKTDVKVIVLMGGDDFWSNGIHLNHIEASTDPAAESWQNIHAINDVVKAILESSDKITVAALRNNAGAGGVMMALACDHVFARDGVVLNPHYKSMGLFGSEYWTYSLPKRVGNKIAQELIQGCMPLGVKQAEVLGLVDTVFATDTQVFQLSLEEHCQGLAQHHLFDQWLANKACARAEDEQRKPLQQYRDEELAKMKRCFAINSEYHHLRHNFVYKISCGLTPERLKTHKNIIDGIVKFDPVP